MKTELLNTVSRNFHKVGFTFKKHSPEILVAAGIIGAVTSAVMACRATTKVNDILEEAKAKVDAVHEVLEETKDTPEAYTEEDGKKALAIVYAKTGLELAKLYGPAVVLGIASVGCILTSHNIIRKRNIALAAAYATIDQGFKEYRGRVIERFGEALDKELKYNIKAKEVDEIVVDEKGKEKVVKKMVNVADPNFYSEYARFFDDGCTGWDKNPEYSLMFLKNQQNYANDILKTRGHLFLNEVYDMLGIPRTKAGQIVGWVYDETNQIGDNYVDFGFFDVYNEKARDFVNGYEKVILLDFNVDGNIYELIG